MKFIRTFALFLTVAACCLGAEAQTYAFTTFAGMSGVGDADGAVSAARFFNPQGLAVDSAGNVYVADTMNNTIRKITPEGVASTFAGSAGDFGSADGTGSEARFFFPYNVAVDSAGNVYVADYGNSTIRKITSAGVVSTLAGLAGSDGSIDGIGSNARFNYPSSIAVDSAGNLYVADNYNHTIRKISSAGVVSTLAGLAGSYGSTDGTGSSARFYRPCGVAVDSAGNVYVADAYNYTIRKITSAGVVSTLAGSAGNHGSANGTGSSARFYYPSAVSLDSAGNVYVADSGNETIRKITSAGVVSTLAGSATASPGSADGIGSNARFKDPSGLALDSAGNVYVADSGNSTIRKITAAGVVSTLSGKAGAGSADGMGCGASFHGSASVTVDSSGTVFVADAANFTVRKISREGAVTTLAGLAGSFGSSDGVGSNARFGYIHGIAVDGSGNVYVADYSYSTIRKVTPDGVVSTVAGSAGVDGSTDGVGSAARFNGPVGLAIDGAGSLYAADSGNHTIRKITASGVVSTVAGLAGSAGSLDGVGQASRFNDPNGVALDSAGNLYVADYGNDAIRMITPNGTVSTFAGLAGSGGTSDGTGSAARFNSPSGIAVDGAGNVFVAEYINCSVRKITPGRVVTTLGGSILRTGYADGLGDAARFYKPTGIAVDSTGVLYVAEYGNDTIRRGVLVDSANLTGSLIALSVRADLVAGQKLIVGFAMSGGSKQVLMRAIGPGLQPYMPAGWQLAEDPRLEFYNGQSQLVSSNDNWGGDAALAAACAKCAGFTPSPAGLDAMLLPSIDGLCTAQFATTVSGTGLMEAYDVPGGMSPRLIGVSARYRVSDGGSLIAGFCVGGSGYKTLVIRAVGPALANYGVSGVLADPKLEIYNVSGQKIAENDNWSSSLSSTFTLLRMGLGLTENSKDAALLVTVPASALYTAVVTSGTSGGAGEALVEVYEVQ